MSDQAETTRGLDPMPRAIFNKARENDRRPWTAAEDKAIIEIASLGVCHAVNPYKDALPDRRFGVILDRRNQLMEAGLCRIPQPL